MASTTVQGVEIPDVGADEDTWGTINNSTHNSWDALFAAIGAKFISGLTLSTAGSSATASVAAGAAGDSSGAIMVLAAAIAKTTSSWAVGNNQGGLDTGSIANSTWYHVYLIKRVDTGVVDVLFSTSASSPTMPTNYTLKRRIGSMKTNGSAQWVLFSQNGDEFLWDVPVNDASGSGISTSPTLYTVSTPLGIKTNCLARGYLSADSAGKQILFSSPDVTSSATNTPDGNLTAVANVANTACAYSLNIRTNTSSQIRGISSHSVTTAAITTYGWIDPRGKY